WSVRTQVAPAGRALASVRPAPTSAAAPPPIPPSRPVSRRRREVHPPAPASGR
ncbi:MAG: hypothetical protein AVDCRST_MAG73-2726, partial [uncultured Thermomicrobiales bacterium]